MGYRLMLKSLREQAGLTQPDMAERLGMKLSTYRTHEQGVASIGLDEACDIAEILKCDINELCGWYESHPREIKDAIGLQETELIKCYRDSTPQRREFIIEAAEYAAAASKDVPERNQAASA